MIEEGEEKLTIEIKRMYSDIQQKSQEVCLARIGYEKGGQAKAVGNAGYQAGILSQEEYLEKELAFLQAETALQSANLALQQSLDIYRWAVLGAVDI